MRSAGLAPFAGLAVTRDESSAHEAVWSSDASSAASGSGTTRARRSAQETFGGVGTDATADATAASATTSDASGLSGALGPA